MSMRLRQLLRNMIDDPNLALERFSTEFTRRRLGGFFTGRPDIEYPMTRAMWKEFIEAFKTAAAPKKGHPSRVITKAIPEEVDPNQYSYSLVHFLYEYCKNSPKMLETQTVLSAADIFLAEYPEDDFFTEFMIAHQLRKNLDMNTKKTAHYYREMLAIEYDAAQKILAIHTLLKDENLSPELRRKHIQQALAIAGSKAVLLRIVFNHFSEKSLGKYKKFDQDSHDIKNFSFLFELSDVDEIKVLSNTVEKEMEKKDYASLQGFANKGFLSETNAPPKTLGVVGNEFLEKLKHGSNFIAIMDDVVKYHAEKFPKAKESWHDVKTQYEKLIEPTNIPVGTVEIVDAADKQPQEEKKEEVVIVGAGIRTPIVTPVATPVATPSPKGTLKKTTSPEKSKTLSPLVESALATTAAESHMKSWEFGAVEKAEKLISTSDENSFQPKELFPDPSDGEAHSHNEEVVEIEAQTVVAAVETAKALDEQAQEKQKEESSAHAAVIMSSSSQAVTSSPLTKSALPKKKQSVMDAWKSENVIDSGINYNHDHDEASKDQAHEVGLRIKKLDDSKKTYNISPVKEHQGKCEEGGCEEDEHDEDEHDHDEDEKDHSEIGTQASTVAEPMVRDLNDYIYGDFLPTDSQFANDFIALLDQSKIDDLINKTLLWVAQAKSKGVSARSLQTFDAVTELEKLLKNKNARLNETYKHLYTILRAMVFSGPWKEKHIQEIKIFLRDASATLMQLSKRAAQKQFNICTNTPLAAASASTLVMLTHRNTNALSGHKKMQYSESFWNSCSELDAVAEEELKNLPYHWERFYTNGGNETDTNILKKRREIEAQCANLFQNILLSTSSESLILEKQELIMRVFSDYDSENKFTPIYGAIQLAALSHHDLYDEDEYKKALKKSTECSPHDLPDKNNFVLDVAVLGQELSKKREREFCKKLYEQLGKCLFNYDETKLTRIQRILDKQLWEAVERIQPEREIDENNLNDESETRSVSSRTSKVSSQSHQSGYSYASFHTVKSVSSAGSYVSRAFRQREKPIKANIQFSMVWDGLSSLQRPFKNREIKFILKNYDAVFAKTNKENVQLQSTRLLYKAFDGMNLLAEETKKTNLFGNPTKEALKASKDYSGYIGYINSKTAAKNSFLPLGAARYCIYNIENKKSKDKMQKCESDFITDNKQNLISHIEKLNVYPVGNVGTGLPTFANATVCQRLGDQVRSFLDDFDSPKNTASSFNKK